MLRAVVTRCHLDFRSSREENIPLFWSSRQPIADLACGDVSRMELDSVDLSLIYEAALYRSGGCTPITCSSKDRGEVDAFLLGGLRLPLASLDFRQG